MRSNICSGFITLSENIINNPIRIRAATSKLMGFIFLKQIKMIFKLHKDFVGLNINENCFYYNNGWVYGLFSKEDLEELSKLIKNTIDNYDEMIKYVGLKNDSIETMSKTKIFSSIKQVSEKKKGIIYIVRCNRTGLYKIGMTTSTIKNRLQSLKTSNPDIELITHYEDVYDVVGTEKHLHDVYESHRVSGEWFSISEDDISTIGWIVKPLF